ncbi:hypothetical protein JKP88DRAFT_227228 [Tribonema minus]|uniref:Uncharacterized protein n=1 Tax=Tribonema minus TaxID=303371 RepID=A0A836C9M1_9STRA|nr:hypothetical protein JKP88DRAFT_227228 [Tribonema minus]
MSSGAQYNKSAKDIWLGDRGAWPIIGIISTALTVGTICGFRTLFFNSDVRVSKHSRKSVLREEQTH